MTTSVGRREGGRWACSAKGCSVEGAKATEVRWQCAVERCRFVQCMACFAAPHGAALRCQRDPSHALQRYTIPNGLCSVRRAKRQTRGTMLSFAVFEHRAHVLL